MPVPVAVLGAGSFGTCLAMLCARDHDVRIWARDPDLALAIDREHRNPRYLPELRIPDRVRATADLEEALHGQELVICAVPSLGVRDVMGRAARFVPEGALLVSTAKGIELETGYRMDQVLEDVLDPVHHPRCVFLSGPSFAREIAERKPTAVTLAAREEAYAIAVQESISCPWFRCYSSTDVVGVEIGGALKNVIAIAVGVCDGLALGQNARAALMTRGLREITRLGVAMGADPLTFLGLAGMGDLVLTCTGDLSRNRSVGPARGRRRRVADRHGVEMPIAHAVEGLLAGRVEPKQAVEMLLARQLRNENE